MNTQLKIGDEVQLKTPENGRYFRGKVGKINEKTVRVNLPNGLYIEKPIKVWTKVVSENE